ncbi:class I adenylate-forming enzyme family protein [Nakamurella sp.]|uniref:class I adenylate-forming enzyme family protein n=1 Tax=Nakamurella sp. TaxID=1869182 RepID=UPI003B3B1FE9
MEPTLLFDLLDDAAARDPHAPALTAGETTLSYADLAAASRRAAAWLATSGVRRRDRVVVLTRDLLLPVPLLVGCARLGAVVVLLHEEVLDPTVRHVLADTEPALLVTDRPDAAAAAVERGVAVATGSAARAGIAAAAPADPARPLSVDPVCLIYTSGSTGLPNAVVSTHAQVVFAARAIQSQLGYRADDVVFSALPLSFDYGLYQVFLAALGGAHLHLGSAQDAGVGLLHRLRAARATVLPAVPSLAAILARLLERYGGRLDLRLLTNTGADMPAATVARLRRLLPGLTVQLMFGLTECKRVSIMPPDGDLARPGACGRPLPGTEVIVLDDDGTALPPGQVGEIVVRGPHVMAGYWRRPALTARRFHRTDDLGVELRSGDYGYLDGDGYLYFVGRRDDIYKSRGFRVSATEVEAAALRVPGVAAAAVLPPTADRPEPVLFAVTDLDQPTFRDRLREQLEHYKIPRHCELVDALPLNQNGKTDKKALAVRADAGRLIA